MTTLDPNLYPNLSGANHDVTVTNSDGSTMQMNGAKDFRAEQDTVNRSNIDKSGLRWEAEQPVGYSGSFTVTRRDVTIDDQFLSDENDWFINQQLAYKSLYETITLPTTLEQHVYLYEKVSLKFNNMGDFSGDKDAEMTVTFKAQRRVKVSGPMTN